MEGFCPPYPPSGAPPMPVTWHVGGMAIKWRVVNNDPCPLDHGEVKSLSSSFTQNKYNKSSFYPHDKCNLELFNWGHDALWWWDISQKDSRGENYRWLPHILLWFCWTKMSIFSQVFLTSQSQFARSKQWLFYKSLFEGVSMTMLEYMKSNQC